MHNISRTLVQWYIKNKRDLPWRNTRDPYKIWLSEIILQQTRVDQGMPYYNRFIEKYPSVSHLASSSERDVLLLWQGLGYYSRARNLLSTARIIDEQYQKQFPNTYTELVKLPGIGPYTAAAIASFCFNEKVAVLDGNVFRFLSRIFNIEIPINSTEGAKLYFDLANELISKADPYNHNQAIMEFGALQCVPKSPNCEVCPLLLECQSFKDKVVGQRPVKLRKQIKKKKFIIYHYSEKSNFVYLKRNVKSGVFEHLYELPKIEYADEKDFRKKINEFQIDASYREVKHELSHIQIRAVFLDFEISELSQYIQVKKEQIDSYPLPRLITKFLYD